MGTTFDGAVQADSVDNTRLLNQKKEDLALDYTKVEATRDEAEIKDSFSEQRIDDKAIDSGDTSNQVGQDPNNAAHCQGNLTERECNDVAGPASSSKGENGQIYKCRWGKYCSYEWESMPS